MSERQHYLPQFYLKKFTSREQRRLLWEYDKETAIVQPSTAKKSGFERDYHAFTKKGGYIDTQTIEKRIKRDFEDPMVPVYEKLRNRHVMDPKDSAAFHLFAASIMVRVPNYIANTREMLTKLFQKSFDVIKKHDVKFRERCFKRGVPKEVLESATVVANRDAALTMSLATFGTPAKIFSRMDWESLHAPIDAPFCTGDNPVFYCDPKHQPGFLQGVGLANQTIEVTFPLSRTICAFGSWQGNERLHKAVPSEVVNLINLRVPPEPRYALYTALRIHPGCWIWFVQRRAVRRK